MKRAANVLLALAALLICGAASAGAVSNGDGDLIVTFEGGISPQKLPRSVPEPVSVSVGGDIKSASGQVDLLPQLQRISVAINRQGRLYSRGLPVCHPVAIQPATPASARRACGGAIVGSGHVDVRVRLPSQIPFNIRAKLLAFNGPVRNGRKLILAQVYAQDPPGAFILVFKVERKRGMFGTVMTTTLPPKTRSWAYLLHFDMTLRRIYGYGGRSRSFISAACSAPAGFDQATFPFAEATYSFADGRSLSLSEAETCQVSE